jgi:hypothetical protein
VILQIWISSRFGVLSKRLLAADESFGFIEAIFTLARLSVKTDLGWDGLRAFEGPRAAPS